MKINPQSFFNFCANHAPLLRGLAERGGEISEVEAMRLIRANPGAGEEVPETAWRRLRELQILVPTEPDSELFFMADPVARLLAYLYNEANPATPEMIRGYVLSLETTGKRLARALDEEDVTQVKLGFEEISLTLRRIHADLDETHHAILTGVGRFKTARGELVRRWTHLRGKQKQFEKEHEVVLARSREGAGKQAGLLKQAEDELADRRKDIAEFSEQKGVVTKPLHDLAVLDKEFSSFVEELERTAFGNLQKEIRALELRLADAKGESREKARQKLDLYGDRVKQKEQTIARFDKLAVTALRRHFSDNELNLVFCVLNRDLLETPLGADGIAVAREKDLLAALRALLKRVRDGVYRDESVSFALPHGAEPLDGLDNLETAREQLAEHRATLTRWQGILSAIEQREKLEPELKAMRATHDAKGRLIFRFEEYQKSKA